SVAFGPDGARLASANEDGTVTVWDAGSGQEACTLKGHKGRVYRVAFSPNGKRLASAGQDDTVRLWDTGSGQELRTLTVHTLPIVNMMRFSRDGARLVWISRDETVLVGTVKAWDVSNGQELCTFKVPMISPRTVVLSPDGTRLASANEDGTV